jgi:hypothetical protein
MPPAAPTRLKERISVVNRRIARWGSVPLEKFAAAWQLSGPQGEIHN